MNDTVIDLEAFADTLPRKSPVRQAIIRLRDAHSAKTDLMSADDFASHLDAAKDTIAASPVAAAPETIGLALLYSAVVLYARATKTTSDHRRTFQIHDQLSADELRVHNILCDLRDDAIAHYGPGGRYDGPAWQKDGVFLVTEPNGGGKVMTASRRIVLNPPLIAALRKQIHRALMIAERRVQEANNATVELLDAAIASQPKVRADLAAARTTLGTFFENDQAGRDAIAFPHYGASRGNMTT